ncbi:MAG: hypothetical protein GMKNLPBB_02043 [Myxococcota bacterium]|nr:hypothetical protein [Myxococcota bacterium]
MTPAAAYVPPPRPVLMPTMPAPALDTTGEMPSLPGTARSFSGMYNPPGAPAPVPAQAPLTESGKTVRLASFFAGPEGAAAPPLAGARPAVPPPSAPEVPPAAAPVVPAIPQIQRVVLDASSLVKPDKPEPPVPAVPPEPVAPPAAAPVLASATNPGIKALADEPPAAPPPLPASATLPPVNINELGKVDHLGMSWNSLSRAPSTAAMEAVKSPVEPPAAAPAAEEPLLKPSTPPSTPAVQSGTEPAAPKKENPDSLIARVPTQSLPTVPASTPGTRRSGENARMSGESAAVRKTGFEEKDPLSMTQEFYASPADFDNTDEEFRSGMGMGPKLAIAGVVLVIAGFIVYASSQKTVEPTHTAVVAPKPAPVEPPPAPAETAPPPPAPAPEPAPAVEAAPAPAEQPGGVAAAAPAAAPEPAPAPAPVAEAAPAPAPEPVKESAPPAPAPEKPVVKPAPRAEPAAEKRPGPKPRREEPEARPAPVAGGSYKQLVERAYGLLDRKKYDDAQEHFRKAIEMNQAGPEAYLGMGDVFLEMKKEAQARIWFKKFLNVAKPGDKSLDNDIRRVKKYLGE